MIEDLSETEEQRAFAAAASRGFETCAGLPAGEILRLVVGDGFLGLLAPEATGGLGLGLRAALPVARAAGRHLLVFPLVEAMIHGLPVVAFDAGAVAEVVGDAGVLLDTKNPRRVAGEVAALLGDPGRVGSLVAAGRGRPEQLGLREAGSVLVTALLGVADATRTTAMPARPGAPVRP